MGEIFLAKRVGVGGFEKTVVLKCMLDSLSGSKEFVGMFFDEAHLAARLSHPNIAQVYDFGVAEGRYYIAMEYVPGEDLSTPCSPPATTRAASSSRTGCRRSTRP
jgi:serine/threonine-protein kinase